MGEPPAAEPAPTGPPIHHVALEVTDLARSEAFYRQVFGLGVVRRIFDSQGDPRSVWLQAGATMVMLERNLIVPPDTRGSGHVLVFEARDIQAAARRLADLGVEVVARTGSSLYVRDPDGHTVGLSAFRFARAGDARSGTAAPDSRRSVST